MKILRITIYPPDAEEQTMVLAEDDFEISVEELCSQAKKENRDCFIICREREFDKGSSFEEIVMETLSLWRMTQKSSETNQALLYYWCASFFPMVSHGGLITGTKPAPLMVSEIAEVFRQLTTRSDFRGFNLQAISLDYKLVSYRKGVGLKVTDIK